MPRTPPLQHTRTHTYHANLTTAKALGVHNSTNLPNHRRPRPAPSLLPQDYFEKNPGQGYCRAVVAPKVQKFRSKFFASLKQ